MSKPKMSASVSMIIILSLHNEWCSGRMKHLLLDVLDSQDKFPPFSENGIKESGQDYQENDDYEPLSIEDDEYEPLSIEDDEYEPLSIEDDEYDAGPRLWSALLLLV